MERVEPFQWNDFNPLKSRTPSEFEGVLRMIDHPGRPWALPCLSPN